MDQPYGVTKRDGITLLSVSFGVPLGLAALTLDSAQYLSTRGLVFVIAGEATLLLAGFAPREIATAFRQAVRGPIAPDASLRPNRVFEAIARNGLALGVLVALIGIVQTVQSFSGSQSQFLASVAEAFRPAFYGAILTILFGVASASVREREEEALSGPWSGEPQNRGARSRFSPTRWLGHVLSVVLLFWITAWPTGGYAVTSWPADSRAWLVVAGVTLFLGVVYGRMETGRGLTLGFASSGVIGGTWGLLEALAGFSGGGIPHVAAGIGFTMTSWFACLAGMLLVGFPLEDRAARGRDPGTLTRITWYLAPLAAVLFMVIVILLVVTPVEKPM